MVVNAFCNKYVQSFGIALVFAALAATSTIVFVKCSRGITGIVSGKVAITTNTTMHGIGDGFYVLWDNVSNEPLIPHMQDICGELRWFNITARDTIQEVIYGEVHRVDHEDGYFFVLVRDAIHVKPISRIAQTEEEMWKIIEEYCETEITNRSKRSPQRLDME